MRSLESNFEKLARILTDKHKEITVLIKGHTAYTDGKTIVLPSTIGNHNKEFYNLLQGFLDHEAAHILFSDFACLKYIKNKHIHEISNVLEDVRVEVLMSDKYIGSEINLKYINDYINIKFKNEVKELPFFNQIMLAIHKILKKEISIEEYKFDKKLYKVLKLIKSELQQFYTCKSTIEVIELAKVIYDKIKQKSEKEKKDGSSKEDSKKGKKNGSSKGEGSSSKDKGKGSESKDKSDNPEKEDEGSREDKKDIGNDDKQNESNGKESDSGDEKDQDDNEGHGEDDKDTSKDESNSEEKGDSSSDKGDIEEQKDKSESESDKSESESDKTESKERDGDGDKETGDSRSEIEEIESCEAFIESNIKAKPNLQELINREIKLDYSKKSSREHLAFSTEYDIVDHLYKDAYKYKSHYLNYKDDVKFIINPLKTKLEALLVAKQNKRWIGEQKGGRLNSRSLPSLIFGTSDRVFKKRYETVTNNVVMQLLVDCSGSMGGSKIELARASAIAFSETLTLLDIAHEICGFTTDWSYGGELESAYSRAGRPSHFTRTTEPLHHYIFKTFNSPAFAASQIRSNCNNVDGESVIWAAKRLVHRKEKRKVMFVFSDGYPAASTPCDILGRHLKTAIKQVTDAGIETVGFGILDNNVKLFYKDHIIIKRLQELPAEVVKKLTKLLDKP